MKNGIFVLVILLLCFSGMGCTMAPKRVEVSPVTRVIPVDKIYYVPYAFGSGVANSCLWAYDDPGILTSPLSLTEGLIFTTFDTSANIVCWLPLELFEMITGKTWERPFMGSYLGGQYGGWTYDSHANEPAEAAPNSTLQAPPADQRTP